jgi:hypothetical protein
MSVSRAMQLWSDRQFIKLSNCKHSGVTQGHFSAFDARTDQTLNGTQQSGRRQYAPRLHRMALKSMVWGAVQRVGWFFFVLAAGARSRQKGLEN